MRAPDILRVFVTTDSPSKELSVKAYNVNRSCPKHYTGYKAVSRFDLIERSSWHTVPGTEKKLKKIQRNSYPMRRVLRISLSFPSKRQKRKGIFLCHTFKVTWLPQQPFPLAHFRKYWAVLPRIVRTRLLCRWATAFHITKERGRMQQKVLVTLHPWYQLCFCCCGIRSTRHYGKTEKN